MRDERLKLEERKQAEELLRESEERYRRQFEEALDAIFLADAETGILIDCNRAATELMGRKKSELVGKHQRILHPPEEIEGEFSRTFKQHLKEKEGQVLKTQVITKRGEIKDVAIKASVFEFRGKKLIQGIFRDITERKKTEEALRESEEKYRELINGMNDTAWVIGFDGKFIDVNDAAVKVLGYSREELLSMGPSDIDTSLTEEQIRDLIKRMPTDEIQVFETTHTTKDGKTIPVEISSSLVTYQGKQAILSIARDITERKKIEAAVAYERDLLHALMDNIPDVIYFKDVASRFTRTNRAHALVLKVKDPEEAIGKTDFDYYAEDFAREAYADEQRIFKTGKPLVEKVEKVKWRDEKFRWVSTTKVPIIDKNGRISGLVGISRDITEIKEMEKKLQEYAEHLEEMVEKRTEELRKSEEKLEDVFKTIPDSIIILDISGNLYEFNETTLDLFGYSREEIIKKNFLDFTVEEDLERVLEGMNQVLEEGFARIEFQISAKDERKIPVELHASVLKDSEGNRVGFVAVLRDITERKRIEEQLLKSERMAAIGQLATMVGHDLRNPLAAIQNASYYLKMKLAASKDAKVKKMFKVMDKEIDYANNITKDLLDLSRAKKPEFKELDLISSIQDALAQLKFPENIALTTKFSEVPAIKADPNQLRRVFQNIALNGAQAMPDGGELTVSTRKNGDFVEVAFTDSGVGIPRENMDKLFTPLFTTKAQGVGLGLAICKDLVEVHNGRIEVKSKVGEGSTFTVKLPVDQIKGGENQT